MTAPDDDDLLPDPARPGWLDAALARPLSEALRRPPPGEAALRQRLGRRLDASRSEEAGKHTVLVRRSAWFTAGEGVTGQWLYRAEPGTGARGLRPGEPWRVRRLRLAAGTCWSPTAGPGTEPGIATPYDGASPADVVHEWLLLDGRVRLDGQPLGPRDYHRRPGDAAPPVWQAETDALLFWRESPRDPAADPAPHTLCDAQAGWPAYAPGIERRVLWQHDGQAALLYRAAAGASVPGHDHGHDEECMMVYGELFLDDRLLQAGDYQLAPAGTGHRITATEGGVVIYAHGDLDLRFRGG